uniref:Uncharacterized protein n=1 Tax=Labrus bergylta TaxID=56723 RepID=A0A3Q3FQP0_9LABR
CSVCVRAGQCVLGGAADSPGCSPPADGRLCVSVGVYEPAPAAADLPLPATFCEHAVSEHAVSEHVVCEHAVSEHVVSEHVVCEHAVSEHVVCEHAVSEHVVCEHVVSEHVVFCEHVVCEHVVCEHVVCEHVVSEHVLSRLLCGQLENKELKEVEQRGHGAQCINIKPICTFAASMEMMATAILCMFWSSWLQSHCITSLAASNLRHTTREHIPLP